MSPFRFTITSPVPIFSSSPEKSVPNSSAICRRRSMTCGSSHAPRCFFDSFLEFGISICPFGGFDAIQYITGGTTPQAQNAIIFHLFLSPHYRRFRRDLGKLCKRLAPSVLRQSGGAERFCPATSSISPCGAACFASLAPSLSPGFPRKNTRRDPLGLSALQIAARLSLSFRRRGLCVRLSGLRDWQAVRIHAALRSHAVNRQPHGRLKYSRVRLPQHLGKSS